MCRMIENVLGYKLQSVTKLRQVWTLTLGSHAPRSGVSTSTTANSYYTFPDEVDLPQILAEEFKQLLMIRRNER